MTDLDIPIKMRDGVTLRADVLRPDAPGRFPVIITQTPYNKQILGGGAEYLVRRGYAYVSVDVRGTGSSEGRWDSFGPKEQRDGPEVVAWSRRRPWSNGKVGLHGGSYTAITQIYTAAQRPKGLKAIFPIVPAADSYRDIVLSGGEINLSFIPLWLGLVTGAGVIPPRYAFTNPSDPLADLADTLTTLLDHAVGVGAFQAPSVVDAVLGGEIVYDGEFFRVRSPIEVIDRVNVPAFVTGGLHDLFQRGEPLLYERLRRNVNARLLMGPWTHSGPSTGVGAGLPADGVPALDEVALRWFDRYLKGMKRRTKVGRIPQVTSYEWGSGRYLTHKDWPPPNVRAQRWHLRGGGSLGRAAERRKDVGQSFLQQPLSGICTVSTAQWSAGLLEPIPCTQDNDTNEQLGEAIWTSKPVGPGDSLRLAGPIAADLWVKTSARDAVLAVRLTDVAPDGTSRQLTAGWLAGSFREVDRSRSRFLDGKNIQPWHPYTRSSAKPMTPGKPTRLRVEVFPTEAAIKPGHRLRVTVGPSDFPHQVPPLPQFADGLGGRVTILNDAKHRSNVVLPVRGGCRAKRRGRRGRCSPQPLPHLKRSPRR